MNILWMTPSACVYIFKQAFPTKLSILCPQLKEQFVKLWNIMFSFQDDKIDTTLISAQEIWS